MTISNVPEILICAIDAVRRSLANSTLAQARDEGWRDSVRLVVPEVRDGKIVVGSGREQEVTIPFCCSHQCALTFARKRLNEALYGRGHSIAGDSPQQRAADEATLAREKADREAPPAAGRNDWATRWANETASLAKRAAAIAARTKAPDDVALAAMWADRARAAAEVRDRSDAQAGPRHVTLAGPPQPVRCCMCRQHSSLCGDVRLLDHHDVDVRSRALAALAVEGFKLKDGRIFCGADCERHAAPSQGHEVAQGVLSSGRPTAPVVTSTDIAARMRREAEARERQARGVLPTAASPEPVAAPQLPARRPR